MAACWQHTAHTRVSLHMLKCMLMFQVSIPRVYLQVCEICYGWQLEYILTDSKVTEKLSLLCHLLAVNKAIDSLICSIY
jgi:hypothetical protein